MRALQGRAASPHPFTQHSEARLLTGAGVPPNLRVIPEVNRGSTYPRRLVGFYRLSMKWVHSCGRSCPGFGVHGPLRYFGHFMVVSLSTVEQKAMSVVDDGLLFCLGD
ncbi:hypothetical protein [Desulfosporosinus orientis]|uniref:hypothetical protein n=1 Tax=Desulfosporosinus orientis TaxID=1563 RepID=UPI0011D1B06A|nr:hypothetical protein [Desulfosporosinus orientis]